MRFADTDAMGVVHHANYLAYFEMARVEALRQLGVDYARVVAEGMHLAVVDAHVRYVKPAVFDDLLLVSTRLADVGRVRFALDYDVQRERDGTLLASGQTSHVCIDAARMRAVRLPAWLVDDLRRLS